MNHPKSHPYFNTHATQLYAVNYHLLGVLFVCECPCTQHEFTNVCVLLYMSAELLPVPFGSLQKMKKKKCSIMSSMQI